MLKTKYYYNPVTCSYERVRTSTSVFVVRSLFFLFFSVGLAALMCMYCQNHFISPKEEELSLYNYQLKQHYALVQKKIEDSLNRLKLLQQQDNHLRMLLDVAPLSAAEHNAGMGGVNKYAHLGKDTLIAQTLSKVDQLGSQLSIQQKSYDRLLILAQKKRSRLQSMPSLPPVAKEHLKRISGFFGMRTHPIFGIRKMHYGVDFAAPIHTPIYAAADGRVKSIEKHKKGYGNHILIEHGNGFQTHYAHMHAVTVKERQLVIRGQQIGTVGKSGDATGPHLHYEVYYNRKRVDPLDYFVGELTAAEYAAVRKLSTHQTKALCSNF